MKDKKEIYSLQKRCLGFIDIKKKDIKYERDFPKIVMESSSNKDKLEYAVKEIVLSSKEKEFTYKQLTEAI